MSSPGASPPDVGVVIVAAGAGVRAGPGEPKQFRTILGIPMLLRALRPFTSHPDVSQVVAVLPRAFADHPPEWLAKVMGDRLILARGGASRTDSVRSGVTSLRADCRFILIHDAARPFPNRTTIDAVIARARAGVGAVAAVPLSDTVKEVGGESRVTRTVPRSGLWR
ncbi:MAG TPA: 2-C-methyl-D-erythritol 4-phosphate cytidylyltransferase, partial [Gemmatimonadales bacterium]|nr:2-C-methyl-D-erythritol 4-phosphate cytidylyltransferase [Gemmatimonadales bacterium]